MNQSQPPTQETQENIGQRFGYEIEKGVKLCSNVIDNLSRAGTYNKLGTALGEMFSTVTEPNQETKTFEEKVSEFEHKITSQETRINFEIQVLDELDRQYHELLGSKDSTRTLTPTSAFNLIECNKCYYYNCRCTTTL